MSLVFYFVLESSGSIAHCHPTCPVIILEAMFNVLKFWISRTLTVYALTQNQEHEDLSYAASLPPFEKKGKKKKGYSFRFIY